MNDLSSGQYSVNKNIKFKGVMLRSDLCDYSDAYIVKVTITVEGDDDDDDDKKRNKKPTLSNNVPFWSCMSEINNTSIDNAEDLDIVMPMHNLLQYSYNYSMTSGSLWNYYRDEINDDANENVNNRINNKTILSKSFEYKTKLIGSMPNDNDTLDTEVVVPLKYFSNFWRSLDLPLINCETELDLLWSKECIISEISVIPAVLGNPDADPPV